VGRVRKVAIVGAAVGAKLSFWLDDPPTAFDNLPDLRHLRRASRSPVPCAGRTRSEVARVDNLSGGAFVLPLPLGICRGSVGCFQAGIADRRRPMGLADHDRG
jgi:phosphatidylglycerol:prolipoprotein diacylglycerol transferase